MRRYKIFVVTCVVFLVGLSSRGFCEELEYDAHLSTLRPRFTRIEAGLPGNVEENLLLRPLGAKAGSDWAFAWFLYGEPGSRSVSVGLSPDGQMYLDRNRDQQFQPDEQLEAQQDSVWTAEVEAEFFSEDNSYEHYERTLLIRRSSGQLEVATAGGMAGMATIDGEPVKAIRLDRDANGLWFDHQDRILLDKNRDGRLNPLSERLACDAVCRIADKQYAIQSDPHGHRLELVELSGVGTLRPLIGLAKTAKVRSLSGTIVSRAGVRVGIRSADEPVECPVGEYRVQDLAVEVGDEESTFLFRFATLGGKDYPMAIERDETTEFDLLGKTELTADRLKQKNKSAMKLTFTPMLKTEHGSYLTGSMRGSQSPTQENRLLVELLCDDDVIDRTTTGFS